MKPLELPHEKIAAITSSIQKMDQLVAVFSQADKPRILQVYLQVDRSMTIPKMVELINLDELADRDLSYFDGPIMGFSALDVLRDDLLTKGPMFYPIEKLFLDQGQSSFLHATERSLAAFLVERLMDPNFRLAPRLLSRAEAKIIRLALSSILSDRDCENLVAIKPASELKRFVREGEGDFIYYDLDKPTALQELRRGSMNTNYEWVVTLDELSHFQAGIATNAPKYLDLRKILIQAGQQTALNHTLRRFALACFHQADAEPACLNLARIMATESCLATEDVDDLVLFAPHNDFDRFIQNGDALRVSRVASERKNNGAEIRPGPRLSVKELMECGLPDSYDQALFSYPAIWGRLSPGRQHLHFDLASIISKAGKELALPRVLWLLSHDLVMASRQNQEEIPDENMTPLVDMASRACNLYGLSNPWMWRQGRWGLYLQESYQNLLEILGQAARNSKEPLSIYYQSLIKWYGSWLNLMSAQDDMINMLESLKKFEHVAKQSSVSGVESCLSKAEKLIMVGEAIIHLQVEPDNYEASVSDASTKSLALMVNVSAAIRSVNNASLEQPMLSSLFTYFWAELFAARRERHQLLNQERDVDRLIDRLQKLVSELQRKRKLLFAPLHEHEVLDFAYMQEIKYLENMLHEQETAAKLTVQLMNHGVDLYQTVTLTLEVVNVGRVAAETLEILVMPPKGFYLEGQGPQFEIPVLPPGTAMPIQFVIRPERMDAELQLEYNFRDRSGHIHNGTWASRLNVRSLDEKPFQVKVNRYQFGRPIQEPGDFYGRRIELQNILSHLKGAGQQNLLLRGPRRMGKTSLLYMLRHSLSNSSVRRLFDIPSNWDVDLDHMCPVFLSLQAFEQDNKTIQVRQFFRNLLENAAKTLGAGPRKVSALSKRFARRAEQIGAVNAALEEIDKILEENPGKRIVMLLDEYDEVYQPGSGELDHNLREFVSAEQRLTWIIASTLALFEAVKSASSPWFNIFQIHELGRMNKEAAIELVENPSQGEGVIWRSDATLALLKETGSHPAFTQLFCAKVIEHLNQTKTNYVLLDTIHTVANQIINETETAHNHFESYWMDTPGIGQLVLLHLDNQNSPLKRDEIRQHMFVHLEKRFGKALPRRRVRDGFGELKEWREKEFKHGMDWVEKITDAVSTDAQRRYIFSVPLFHRWLYRKRGYENLTEQAFDKIEKEMERDDMAIH